MPLSENTTNLSLYAMLHDTSKSLEARNGEMLKFIYFDNKVFGQKHFDNIPTGILTQMTKEKKTLDIESISLETNNLLMYVTNCYELLVINCSFNFLQACYCSGYNTSAGCSRTMETQCENTTVYIDTGGGGAGSPSTGPTTSPNGGGTPTNPDGTPSTGGTPGGGTPPPPPNPCGKVWYRHANCLGGVVKNPCENLKKHISGSKGINLNSPSIGGYLSSKLSEPKEFGFSFKKENDNFTYEEAIGNEKVITVTVGGMFFCSIHTHPYPTANPMFSWEDIYSLQQYYQNVNASLVNDVAIYLIVKDQDGVEQMYSVKVDDYSMLTDFISNEILTTVKAEDIEGLSQSEMSKKTLQIMNAKQHKYNLDNPNQNQEITFLKYFEDIGCSLYKANTNRTSWEKLSLSNDPINPITKTPCN